MHPSRIVSSLTFALCLLVAVACCERSGHHVVARTRLSSDAASTASAGIVARPPGADFGLPVYPGAVLDRSSVQRVDMGGYYQLHSSFDSAASPAKIISFYRAKLNALAPSPGALVETSTSGKTTFILKRDARSVSLVAVEPNEGATGSEIHLTDTGAKEIDGGAE